MSKKIVGSLLLLLSTFFCASFFVPKSAVQVKTATAKLSTVRDQIEAQGIAGRTREQTATSITSGVVDKVLVKHGDKVEYGQILYTLDTTLIESQLDILYAQKQALSLGSEAVAATATLLASANAQIEALLLQMSVSQVRADFSAEVLSVGVKQGEPALGGVLIGSETTLVRATVSDSDASRLYIGQPAAATRQGETKTGYIESITASIQNPGYFTVEVYFDTPVSFPYLSLVDVTFTKHESTLVCVPYEALFDYGCKVMRVVDGMALTAEVSVIDVDRNSVAVRGNISPGDEVILNHGDVSPGDLVRSGQ